MKSGLIVGSLESNSQRSEAMTNQEEECARIICPVSVVIPCFNSAATIGRALTSVITQTQLPLEIIVVDDASSDDSCIVLRRWMAEASGVDIRLLPLPHNQGAAVARNKGWGIAKGEYVAFLDADDYWLPHKIECQYGYMQANPDVALCGHGHCFSTDRLDVPDNHSLQAEWISSRRLLISNPMVTPSVMVRADVPFRFMEGKRHMEDHLLWMEIAMSGLCVVRLNIRLTVIGKAAYGAGGLSAQLWAMEKGDLHNYWYLRKTGNIGLPTAMLMAMLSLAKYLRRLCVVAARRLAGPQSQQM
jgi:glycosyltransferase involved in cell wall biosynthesis